MVKEGRGYLKWLADHFEIGVEYPETEVNKVIKGYHPDCATVRRELIANKLMKREKVIFWRVTAKQKFDDRFFD